MASLESPSLLLVFADKSSVSVKRSVVGSESQVFAPLETGDAFLTDPRLDSGCSVHLDDDPAAWHDILALLLPGTDSPALTWDNVERVATLADKYHFARVLCCVDAFLASPDTPLSACVGHSNYCWRVLALADRWHLQAAVDRCIDFIAMHSCRLPPSADTAALESLSRQLRPATLARLVSRLMRSLHATSCAVRQLQSTFLGYPDDDNDLVEHFDRVMHLLM